jgi:ribosomal protein L11 methyltransferase
MLDPCRPGCHGGCFRRANALPSSAVDDKRYPYVAVDVNADDADEASARLFDLGAQGVEERDATTLARGVGGRGSVTLIASFGAHDEARSAIAELPREWSPRVEEVVGDGWRDEWKKHFEPFRICEGIVVRPPWREYFPTDGEQVVVLEPGRAFGTGLHETTSLVAEVLGELGARLKGASVLDVGCGSGILSIVALALGAGSARAIDVDPDATAVTRENAERNAMSARLAADETAVQDLAATFPVVVANIEATTLVQMAPGLTACVEPGGVLVLSGILAQDVAPSQVPSVRQAYAGLSLEQARQRGEWVALVLRAGGTPEARRQRA